MVVTSSSYHMVRRTWWLGWVGGSLYIGVWVSVNTVFYRIIRAVTIGTHSGGNFSISVCADKNEIEMLTMSNKITFNEDSSEENTNNPLPAKKAATSSPASEQSGTRVPKGRGGGDLPKISAFPANAPQPRGRGSSQGDKSPARTPRFSNNTGEGSLGRNRGPINRHPP